MNQSTTKRVLEIQSVSVFGAGWFCMGIHAFWGVLYGIVGYSLHWLAGAKEPNLLILLLGSPLAWISGATTATVFNLIAKLFGGLKLEASIRELPQPAEKSTSAQALKQAEATAPNRP